jgi:hypothetical protein
LEGITSSPLILLNNPEDKSQTGRGESEKRPESREMASSDHIYYYVNWRNVPEYFPGGKSDHDIK